MEQGLASFTNQEYKLKPSAPVELNEKRSKFIGVSSPIEDPNSLKEIIGLIKLKYPLASHYCYAFRVGTGKTKIQGVVDDGEPKHTAGKPILEVLKGSNITNTLICVVRYFGGIKLGTGGLVRMYTKTAQEVVKNAPFEPVFSFISLTFTIEYTFWQTIEEMIKNHGFIYNATYTDLVEVDLELPELVRERFIDELRDLTKGRVRLL